MSGVCCFVVSGWFILMFILYWFIGCFLLGKFVVNKLGFFDCFEVKVEFLFWLDDCLLLNFFFL